MTVSSRTPDGWPGHCVLCGKDFYLEYSDPGNDTSCPYCGHLLLASEELLNRFRLFYQRAKGDSFAQRDPSHTVRDIGLDSLETIEFVMRLEEEFGVSISENEAAEIATVADAIRFILAQKRRPTGGQG